MKKPKHPTKRTQRRGAKRIGRKHYGSMWDTSFSGDVAGYVTYDVEFNLVVNSRRRNGFITL